MPSPQTPCSPVPRVRAARRTRLLAVLAVAALAAAACGDDGPVDLAEVAGCAAESTAGSGEFSQIAIPAAEITLVEPGAGELRTLIAEPQRESAQRVELSTESTVSGLQTGPAGTAEPETEAQSEQATLPMAVQASCETDGDYELTLGEISSTTPELDALIPAASGTRGGLSMRPGMLPTALRLAPPDDAGSAARLAVEQSLVQALQRSVPLPTEPVGEGALWTVRRTIDGSITLNQTMEVRLVSIDGDRVSFDVALEEDPVDDVFRIPGSSDTLRITRFSTSGQGRLTVDLTRPLPVFGMLRLSGARELVGADPNVPVIQQTGFVVSWQDGTAEAPPAE